MVYHKYIFALIFTMLLSFTQAQPVSAEKAGNSTTTNPKITEEKQPVSLKHIIVIAVDGWTQDDLKAGTMPRLVGLSQEGIKGKVLDYPISAEISKQHQRLIGELPGLYRNSQRLSMLVDGSRLQSKIDGKFNYIFSQDKADWVNPEQIMSSVTDNFSKLDPYFTLVTLSSPSGTAQNKAAFYTRLDTAVGSLFAKLHEKGVYDHTMVVILGKRTDGLVNSNSNSELIPPVYPLIMKGPHMLSGIALPTVNI